MTTTCTCSPLDTAASCPTPGCEVHAPMCDACGRPTALRTLAHQARRFWSAAVAWRTS